MVPSDEYFENRNNERTDGDAMARGLVNRENAIAIREAIDDAYDRGYAAAERDALLRTRFNFNEDPSDTAKRIDAAIVVSATSSMTEGELAEKVMDRIVWHNRHSIDCE